MTDKDKAEKRIANLKRQVKALRTQLKREIRRNRYQLLCRTGDPIPQELSEEFEQDYKFL